MGETLRVRVLRVNKTVWSLDCRTTATPRSTRRPVGSSAPGGAGCCSSAAKGQKAGRWREGAAWVQGSAAGRQAQPRRQLPPLPPRPHPFPAPQSPDLEREPGRGAGEGLSREEQLPAPQAAVCGPRPAPRPGAQEAAHTLRKARRLRASGQQQQHPRLRHHPPGSLSAWRPLVAERRPLGPRGRKAEMSGITFGEDPWVELSN